MGSLERGNSGMKSYFRKRFGKRRLSNCWLFALQLILTGRVKYVVFRLPYHMMVVTKRGNIVHLASERRLLWDLLWVGRAEVLRPAYLAGRRSQKKLWPFRQGHSPAEQACA